MLFVALVPAAFAPSQSPGSAQIIFGWCFRASILPDARRWLWRSAEPLPAPLTKDNLKGDDALVKILPQEGGWELVMDGIGWADAACSDAEGNFYFSDL